MLKDENLYKLRVNFLKQFNNYIYEYFSNVDFIIERWETEAIPKDADDNHLMNIAKIDEYWCHVVNIFADCCELKIMYDNGDL